MFNQVILFGRLVADPETKQTPSGSTICNFTIAVDRQKKQGEESIADFVRCTAWSNTAEMISRYFVKGKPILVVGRLQNNDYTDKNNIKHYSMSVMVNNVSFTINDKTDPQPQQYQQQTGKYVQQTISQGFEEILSDGEVPF